MATTASASSSSDLRGLRLLLGYAVVAVFLVVAIAISISIGNSEDPPTAVAGFYTSGSTASARPSSSTSPGQFVDLDGPGQSDGKLRLDDDRLTGDVTCADGSSAERRPDRRRRGDRARRSTERSAASSVAATFAGELPEPGASGKAAPKKRTGEETFGRLMLAIAAVILAARLVGALLATLGQPR